MRQTVLRAIINEGILEIEAIGRVTYYPIVSISKIQKINAATLDIDISNGDEYRIVSNATNNASQIFNEISNYLSNIAR